MQTGVDWFDGYPVAAAYTTMFDVLKYWYHTNYSMEYLAGSRPTGSEIMEKLTPEDRRFSRK